jgi:hypothetical protein
MGQAKRRGTYDERRQAAIVRDQETNKRRKDERAEREALLTHEERHRRHMSQMMYAVMAGWLS